MWKLAWRNITTNAAGSTLSISLVALSVALVIFLSHVNQQFQRTMEKNSAGVHLILAAKGSPLQSVLCNLYHVDNPTGNISIDEVKAFLNPKHPLIKNAIPLSVGDSYKAHRIVGTTLEIQKLYDLAIGQGRWWARSNEVVIGAQTAKELNIKIDDVFQSTHGLLDDGMGHTHDGDLRVVGILERSGGVIDNLILTSFKTIWAVHGDAIDEPVHESHDHDHHDHGSHDHEHHAHEHDKDDILDSDMNIERNERDQLLANPDKAITSLLLTFKNHNHQTLNMMRSINENSTVMAANPAWELNRLYSMVGVGADILSYLAWLIAGVSVVSIFLSLLQFLRSRKYELALLRVLGSRPGGVFSLVIIEGLLQVLIGLIIGFIVAHIGLYLSDKLVSDAYHFHVQAWRPGRMELVVAIVALCLGVLAALWPAYLAYKTDVSKTLQTS